MEVLQGNIITGEDNLCYSVPGVFALVLVPNGNITDIRFIRSLFSSYGFLKVSVRGRQDGPKNVPGFSSGTGKRIRGLAGSRLRSVSVLDEPPLRLDQSSYSTSISSSGVQMMGVLIP